MTPKSRENYAERAKRSDGLALLTLRTVFGFALMLLSFSLLGFLLYGQSLAVLMGLYFVILGPLLVTCGVWAFVRFSRKIRRIDLRDPQFSDLTQNYFEAILKAPGPDAVFYLLDSRDIFFLWLERGLFFRSQQGVLITTAWLEEAAPTRERDFHALWREISELSWTKRRFRSVHLLLWVTAMLPLEILFHVYQRLFDRLGWHDMPRASFWCLRSLASLRNFLFGVAETTDPLESLLDSGSGNSPLGAKILPKVKSVKLWSSLCLGVWISSPRRSMHPLLKALVHSENILS